MKQLPFVASLALVALPAPVAFAYYPVTYYRCTADQLFGTPSLQTTNPEGRTGYGRQKWARTANTHYRFNGNATNATRYWLPFTYDPEVENAIQANVDLYPVFANYDHPDTPIWTGPGPNNSTWSGTTFSQIASLPFTNNFDLPSGVRVDGLCEAGCYSPEQEIRVGEAFVSVVEAHESGQSTLTTLAPNATIDSLEFIRNRIAKWTVDIAPAYQSIITLRMKSGGELRVTTEHPLVTSEGVMKRAEDLVLGESLVQEDGSPDPVVSMVKNTEFTKVYNLRPTTTDLTSNILVAQGYLTGSARFQNEYLKYLNRVLLRHTIPSAVIVRSPSSP